MKVNSTILDPVNRSIALPSATSVSFDFESICTKTPNTFAPSVENKWRGNAGEREAIARLQQDDAGVLQMLVRLYQTDATRIAQLITRD